MAKATLPTNFKDDILASSMGSKRRYNVINNSDGTISLEDVTTYTQVGSTFGAAQINATNKAVNASADASKIIDDYNTLMANTQAGYMAGALAVKQLNSNLVKVSSGGFKTVAGSKKVTLDFKPNLVIWVLTASTQNKLFVAYDNMQSGFSCLKNGVLQKYAFDTNYCVTTINSDGFTFNYDTSNRNVSYIALVANDDIINLLCNSSSSSFV